MKATYISRFLALEQEFFFADAKTLMSLSSIYNSSWYGSVLWPLDDEEVIKCESTFNRSVKKLFKLPQNTHRYLIEPVSQTTHLRVILGRRFLQFIENIQKTTKPLLKILLRECKDDTRTVTGSNLRYLMLESGISKTPTARQEVKYHKIEEDKKWRIEMIDMILEDHNDDEDHKECLAILCSE